MIYCEYFGARNNVSIRKQGTHCIAPKLRRAHFKGSIMPRCALQRLQNSAGQICSQFLPQGILEPSKCAPRNYRAFKVRPEEFWSNAMCAPLFHEYIVMGAKISIENHLKFRLSLFFKVFFVNRCYFRDLYIHWY